MMRLIVFFLAFVLLSGCAAYSFREIAPPPSQEAVQKEKEQARSKEKRQVFYQALQQSLKERPQQKKQEKKKKAQRSLTRYVDKAWLGDESEFFTPGQQNLPDAITHQQELVFISAVDLKLKHISRRISEMAGIPVRVRTGHVGEIKLVKLARLNYRGALTGLLDVVASAFEASWSYDRKSRSLVFTRLMTRAFDFYAPPDGVAVALPVLDSRAAGEAASPLLAEGKRWQGIKRILASVMPSGSRIYLSPEAGKITLTTTPPAMQQAAKFIRAHNRYFIREIHLNVQVLSFDVSGGRSFSDRGRLNLPALLEAIGLDSQIPLLDEDKKSKKPPQIKLADVGTDVIIAALRKVGKVSVLTITDTRTRDGKVIPIKTISQRAYLPRPTAAAASGSAASGSAASPATITTGFSMNLRPHILPRDRVQVDMSMSLRLLSRLKSLGAGNNRVQIPEISTSSWAQETVIPDGTTLVVSGFEHDVVKVEADVKSNVEADKVESRKVIIILITPTIVDRSDETTG